MDVTFSVRGIVGKPIEEVYEAVADPAILSRYFSTGGAEGRMESGATVMWDFHDFPGAFPVKIISAEPHGRIELAWGAAEGTVDSDDDDPTTTVVFEFEAIEPERTLVIITESGWSDTPAGREASYGNCMGWTGMLAAMKVWLEHGIVLREGFYV